MKKGCIYKFSAFGEVLVYASFVDRVGEAYRMNIMNSTNQTLIRIGRSIVLYENEMKGLEEVPSVVINNKAISLSAIKELLNRSL